MNKLQAIFSNANRVVSSGIAVVDGKSTGLAGCSAPCGRACLRADSALTAVRVPHGNAQSCVSFISAA